MYTIEDVAREAKVSTATVSRFLNGTGTVSEKTAKRVRSAIKKFGYKPNAFGRGLRTNKTNLVLVSISTFVNSFYSKVIKGIEDVAEKNGYHVLVGSNDDNTEKEILFINLLKNHLADGMIFMRPSISAEEMDELYKEFPVIQCCEHLENSCVPFVSIDNKRAAYDVVCSLAKRGYKRIAFLGAPELSTSAAQRLEGYKEAICDCGLEYLDELVVYGNYGFRKAFLVSLELIKTQKPDAIFAISDRMAAGVISAAHSLGVDVPGQLSVIGFDNIDLSYIVTPKLSTVSQNQYEMGRAAMTKLIEIIENKTPSSTIVDYEIIWRDSVKNKF